MQGEVIDKISLDDFKNVVKSDNDFSSPELKLLNLIAEVIVNISIREAHEKSD